MTEPIAYSFQLMELLDNNPQYAKFVTSLKASIHMFSKEMMPSQVNTPQ